MPRMPTETFHVEGRQGANAKIHILSLKGAVTSSSAPALNEAVRGATAPGLILDMTEVTYVDSMAIGVLVQVYVSCNKSGRKLALVGLNHRVVNVLRISGGGQLFDTHATVPEAETALR